VTGWKKAGIADKTSIARQRHGKRVSAVTNNRATTEELLEAVFFYAFRAEAMYGETTGVFSQSRMCGSFRHGSAMGVASQREQESLNTEPEEFTFLGAVA
jgi:hypothetical protein